MPVTIALAAAATDLDARDAVSSGLCSVAERAMDARRDHPPSRLRIIVVSRLERADIIVLFLSPDALSCAEGQALVSAALARHKDRSAEVVAVWARGPVTAVDLAGIPLLLPDNHGGATPMDRWRDPAGAGAAAARALWPSIKRRLSAEEEEPPRTEPMGPGRPPPAPIERAEPGLLLDGRFRVQSSLRREVLAEVFSGADERTGQPVWIKTPVPEHGHDERPHPRFAGEARLLRYIRSACVPALLFEEEDPRLGPFLVFGPLKGEPLIERLKRQGPLPFDSVRPIIAGVYKALAAIHGAGVVHTHLRPSCVWLEARGEGPEPIRILDFGPGRRVDDPPPQKLLPIAGALGFMPPEQIGNARTADPRQMDLYGCATIAYQALAGRLPFQARNVLQMVELRARTGVPALSGLAPGPLPRGADPFFFRALALNASERFQSAEEAAAAWSDM